MSTEFRTANRTFAHRSATGTDNTRMSFRCTQAEWNDMNMEAQCFGDNGWTGTCQEFFDTQARECTTNEFETRGRW